VVFEFYFCCEVWKPNVVVRQSHTIAEHSGALELLVELGFHFI
jgi:hypothetical protein